MLLRNRFFLLLFSLVITMPMSCSHGKTGVDFYNKHISPIDGGRCNNYPTCSQYANLAVKEHGLFIGLIMACDRLLRCGGDTSKLSKKIIINSHVIVYDPVQSNDFWWFKKRSSE